MAGKMQNSSSQAVVKKKLVETAEFFEFCEAEEFMFGGRLCHVSVAT